MHIVCILRTVVHCTVVLVVVLAVLALTGTVVGIAASFRYVACFLCIHLVMFGPHMVRMSQFGLYHTLTLSATIGSLYPDWLDGEQV